MPQKTPPSPVRRLWRRRVEGGQSIVGVRVVVPVPISAGGAAVRRHRSAAGSYAAPLVGGPSLPGTPKTTSSLPVHCTEADGVVGVGPRRDHAPLACLGVVGRAVGPGCVPHVAAEDDHPASRPDPDRLGSARERARIDPAPGPRGDAEGTLLIGGAKPGAPTRRDETGHVGAVVRPWLEAGRSSGGGRAGLHKTPCSTLWRQARRPRAAHRRRRRVRRKLRRARCQGRPPSVMTTGYY